MATKKEGAQRLLDTLESKRKLSSRLAFSVGQGVVVSGLVWYFTTHWQFAVASVFIIGLLIQFAFERMSNSIEASRLQALSDLGWKEDTLSDEEYRARIDKTLNG
ncbi:MAG: hypothetical protein HN458_03255 [Euryarchaeota archaeon]|jgi:hypothetical protein|nr:hypothetical protein [Euryarchaeota archaeon]MDC3290223.1 hypothetical protein [Candidatus Poseidoniaceae archaeon]